MEIDEKELPKMEKFFDGAAALKLPHELEIRQKSDAVYRWIGAFKKDQLLGWAKLKPTSIAKIDVHAVELVYIVPRYRKTVAAGWLFLYAKDIVGTPIVLGDDSTYGGVAFKDGKELMAALKKTGKFELSLVDLKTGQKSPLVFPLKDNRFTTVMIESLVSIQLTRRLAEGHSLPGKIKQEYQSEISWLGEVTEEGGAHEGELGQMEPENYSMPISCTDNSNHDVIEGSPSLGSRE